ncbi:MAG: LamG domain-containing protein, partial [Planctomycetes bacterium]|nr:LamG domain-containing protein [Planctomycetota bacterium]
TRRNARILGKMDGGGHRAWSTGIEASSGGVAWPATLQVSSNGSDVISSIDDASLPLDQWVHYAGVYTPGTSMDVYLDGDLAFSLTTGIPASQYSANGNAALIGNRPGCGDCGWYGALDEVRMYTDALSETDIEAIMAIPEPTTMLLLSLGGLALIRRKR